MQHEPKTFHIDLNLINSSEFVFRVLIEMGVAPKDAIIPENSLSELIVDKHIDFIANYETNKNTKYEYSMSESLRMSGIYWACTALDIMNASDRMEKNRVKSI